MLTHGSLLVPESVVVVVPHFASACARTVMRDTLGVAPAYRDGSWVWTLGATSTLGALRSPTASSCS